MLIDVGGHRKSQLTRIKPLKLRRDRRSTQHSRLIKDAVALG
jgi:hypothetical protein